MSWRYCNCRVPSPEVRPLVTRQLRKEIDGVSGVEVQVMSPRPFCGNTGCGREIPSDELRAIATLDARIRAQPAAPAVNGAGPANPNGAAAPPADLPPGLAEEIAARVRFVPPIAVGYQDAARMLGIGRTLFIQEVLPHVRVLRIRGKRVVPVAELERWAEEHAERPIAEQVGEA